MRLLFELYQLGVEESFLCTPLKEIVSVPDNIIILFFPPLLRILFSILSKPPGPSDVRSLSFVAILHVLSVVTKYSPQSLSTRPSKSNAASSPSSSPPPATSSVSLNAIGNNDKKLTRSALLESYLNYQFYNTSDTKDLFYHLVSVWLKFARDPKVSMNSSFLMNPNIFFTYNNYLKFEGIKDLAAFSWFFFDIIVKSLALHLSASSLLGIFSSILGSLV